MAGAVGGRRKRAAPKHESDRRPASSPPRDEGGGPHARRYDAFERHRFRCAARGRRRAARRHIVYAFID
ncbi:hypothetical protein GBP346_B2583 [Burkholderia pseudomallei MSHR346]|nr:hypothetical protein GBP346_B2583 [Burkholderia pseudomallei MSHR346]